MNQVWIMEVGPFDATQIKSLTLNRMPANLPDLCSCLPSGIPVFEFLEGTICR